MIALGLALAAAPAAAGPPFLNDDPVPTDAGHSETYIFVGGAGTGRVVSGDGGVDMNFGAAKDLQLTLVLPLSFEHDHSLRGGAGTVEMAAKYRFTHQAETSWLPDIAIFPRLFLPTASRRFGTGHASLLLPVWAQKDRGPWSVFGGGGYRINPGAGQRDYWQGGMAVSRALGPRLTLGAEAFAQTADSTGGGGYRALNGALTYKMTPHWSLLASGGPTWEKSPHGGYVFYLAMKADY